MPKPTTQGKGATLKKLGHTTTGKYGDDPYTKGKVPKPREINPQG